MRKKVILVMLITTFILSFAAAGLAADKVVKWKAQSYVPAGMLYHTVLEHMAADLKRLSQGRFVWEVHPAGSLVPPFEAVKAVSDGVYEANFGYAAQWVGKIPVSPLFCAVPGGFNALDMEMWLNHGGGLELYQEMYDHYGFNLKVFPVPPISMENFMWSKKPIHKIADMKGLKMRMMPLMGDVLQKHGMSVIFVPGGEIMPNLQRGVLDAAEYSIPAFDKTLGIWEICKYVMLPGIHQPSSQTEILVNKKAYEALPDDLKLILEYSLYASRLKEWLWMESENIKAVDFFKEKGIEIISMDPEEVQTMVKWAHDYLDEMAAKDEFFAKVWNSQKAWGKKWYPYVKTYNLPH